MKPIDPTRGSRWRRATQRQTMVDCQIRTFDVTDQAVIGRFLEVHREMYVPGALKPLSYSDAPLEISDGSGEGRCLLPPLAGVFLHSLKHIFADVVQCDLVPLLPFGKKSPGIGSPASNLIHPNISFTVEYGDRVAQCERASLFVKHDIQQ